MVETSEDDDFELCPICAEAFRSSDVCATDITEGTCHAACLEGSPVVDLSTGDEIPHGKIAVFRYGDAALSEPAIPEGEEGC
jgi:hypothetical protein